MFETRSRQGIDAQSSTLNPVHGMKNSADQCQPWNTVQDSVTLNPLRGHVSQRNDCCTYNHVVLTYSPAA
ncbi:predicted protein [Pyrenophora tritici-repentis Pt-1C-BFP]|uniref:Uncharacterized protein n=1 Tax=Pyrenophora tritici-repentis (strain Pt-1C-BFP) TaxID=426418 RepID=B2WG40_PYRTR|nr:uncharacterized protein PTRG_08896 [Pyrenophora tritici-repentis Pt-1C-BFP]EDU41947.1 predicted protein [Pyrenophora tritici-repentis Pt-1C-BFP]